MRFTLTIFFALITMNAYALISDRSIELSRILAESRVTSFGKRQFQEARAHCDNSPRSKLRQVECTIIVEGPGHYPNTVYEELRGDKAKELSELLIEFNVKPSGKRQIQNADITCRLPKKKQPGPVECKVINISTL